MIDRWSITQRFCFRWNKKVQRWYVVKMMMMMMKRKPNKLINQIKLIEKLIDLIWFFLDEEKLNFFSFGNRKKNLYFWFVVHGINRWMVRFFFVFRLIDDGELNTKIDITIDHKSNEPIDYCFFVLFIAIRYKLILFLANFNLQKICNGKIFSILLFISIDFFLLQVEKKFQWNQHNNHYTE